jgi:two-component system, OmpR family, sensor histidine kinase KdpD
MSTTWIDSATPSIDTPHRAAGSWKHYLATAAVVAGCALLGWVSNAFGLTTTNIAMIFLAAVAVVAARFGRGPAIAAAVLGVLVFDYFFVVPLFTFARSDTQYLVTLSVMLGIGVLISELTARLQDQLRASQEHEQQTEQLFHASQRQERRTAQLYRMTRQLSELAGTEFLVPRSGRQLTEVFDAEVVLFLSNPGGELLLRFGNNTTVAGNPANLTGAQWVAQNRRTAGLGTDLMPDATALLIPMVGSQRTVGVLGIRPNDARRLLGSQDRRMLETCASLIALSIERDQSRLEVQQAQLRVQAEQFRNSLLSSVSHDLRTPLAMIAVTAASLLENSADSSSATSREMLQTVVTESHRLARQVDNLLEMARLNSGTQPLNCDWQVLEELVGVVLARIRSELQEYSVQVNIPADLPLLWVASELIEQVLVNLLENAVRYTPPGTRIEINARSSGSTIEIGVADNGPGLPPGCETKVFDKFYRGKKIVADGQRGIGLGLPICQGIVQAHGGKIVAINRPSGGAEFIISLSCRLQNLDENRKMNNLVPETQS